MVFPKMSSMRLQNKRMFDKSNERDLREFALVGEGSWCEEFGDTEMGTLMELTLIFSGACGFPNCGKH